MQTGAAQGPLAGYRVLELGSTVAGPFCGRLFADFGAEVIKIEPLEGDGIRAAGRHHKGKSLYAASILRNKDLVALDLRSARGQDIARKLVAKCDIVIENFRPGGLEKWGLGYADLAEIRPDIIMVRISGFGQTGPYSQRPGYGVIAEAASGLRHLTGDPDRPPARVSIALTDYITGLYAAFGAMMALNFRERTGRGQCVDAALAECAFSLLEPHVPAYDKLGIVANRTGSGLAGSAPNNLYPTQDDCYIHIQAAQNAVFKRFAHAIGMPQLLTDPRFADALARGKHVADIDAVVTTWTGSLKIAEIERILAQADVPAGRINTVADIFADPQFRARDMIVETPDDELGTVKLTGCVPKMSLTPGRITRSGGSIGRDTRNVLSELAGVTPEEMEQLIRDRIILCPRSPSDRQENI
jgi:crotonobetainyl-CoA:carnitine CoA-transferase CaiB-like acyl-CoA transferase